MAKCKHICSSTRWSPTNVLVIRSKWNKGGFSSEHKETEDLPTQNWAHMNYMLYLLLNSCDVWGSHSCAKRRMEKAPCDLQIIQAVITADVLSHVVRHINHICTLTDAPSHWVSVPVVGWQLGNWRISKSRHVKDTLIRNQGISQSLCGSIRPWKCEHINNSAWHTHAGNRKALVH